MNGKDFAKWMDEAGIDLPAAAAHFGVSPQTIYNWRSTNGVPSSRDEWVTSRMQEYLATRKTTELPNRIILEPSRSQFRTWNRAALMAGQLIDDWAAAALDEAAAEDEVNQTGSDAPFNPLQSLPKVAEPGDDYLPKKGNGA